MGLLDGTDRAPPKTVDAEDSNGKKTVEENPAYLTWISAGGSFFA